MSTPTIEEFARRVVEIGTERPDYIYEKYVSDTSDGGLAECWYFRDGQPSCIVGHALASFGVTPNVDIEGIAAGDAIRHYFPEILPEFWEDRPEIAITIDDVQSAQDRGRPWGEAIVPLKEYLENLESV